MAILPTVRIKHEGFADGVLINECDFDPKVHKLYDEPKKSATAAKADDDSDDDGKKGGKGK